MNHTGSFYNHPNHGEKNIPSDYNPLNTEKQVFDTYKKLHIPSSDWKDIYMRIGV